MLNRAIDHEKKSPNIRIMIFLSVAYAANTGGTGTLTGTGSNLVRNNIVCFVYQSNLPFYF